MKVQAALCLREGAPLEIRDVELAPPGPGEVLVRWGASGICASDKFVVTHAGWPKPYIPGHEGAGIVEALGDGVGTLTVGDHVVSDLLGACGQCRQCRTGRPRLCEPQRRRAVPDIDSRFSLDGTRVGRFGHHEIATFVEACVVPEASLTKIPDDVPFEAACLLGCCALSGASAVLTRAQVAPGSRVAVFGCGGLGLAGINAAQLCGARQIIAIDVVPRKLDWAREFGATDTVNALQGDPAEAVSAATGGAMADFAFDFSGSAAAMNQTVGVVRNGGMVVLEGAGPPGTQLVVDQAELIDNEKVITGAHAGGGIPALDIPLLIDRFRAGTFKLDALVSHRLSLEEVNDGFDLMTRGEARRSVIMFGA